MSFNKQIFLLLFEQLTSKNQKLKKKAEDKLFYQTNP